jgi:hypothetical protein
MKARNYCSKKNQKISYVTLGDPPSLSHALFDDNVANSVKLLLSKKKIFVASLGSISPTFYEQLLGPQIPKAQKDSQVLSLLNALSICTQKSCS